jgi:membrane-bound lytic murein transglycosylase D
LRDAIEKVSALFDVPDSVVSGKAFSLVDVDSTSGAGEDGEPTWDIEVDSYVTQDKVAHYVNLFLGTARTRFVERLQRGKQYEPMIREKFRAAGIPEDMYFLGLVESGFDPHAYSRAAAVGMWQFMSSTARGVGLRVDWWVDERRDPMKSTDAAARFIRDLRGQFGSLYLAAAAYNGGPGRVSRGLKKFDDALDDVNGEDCFFALAEQEYLRAETKNYVPQLIAAALIGKAPARYGIQLDSVPRYAYDSVFVPAATPLSAVARATGRTLRDVQLLNPHVLRGVTPPDMAIPVRVPAGAAEGFDSLWAALPDSERVAFHRVTTRKGETLAGLAKKHGVQTRHLSMFNRRLSVKKGRLTTGQVVLVPTAATVAGALDVPDPSIERYGSSSASGRVTHVVKRGESLGLIAKRYRTSVSALVRLNRLKKNVIYPGQTIIVRGTARPASSTSSRRTSTARKAPAKTSTKSTGAARKTTSR